MFLDAQTQFSDAQALSVTGAVSTNVVDLSVFRNIGRGEPVAVVFTIDVAADVADADETYTFEIETDDNVGFASATTLQAQAIAGAALTAGSLHVLPLGYDNERYLRINYVLGGTTPTVTVTANLQPMVMGIDSYQAYPNGYTISG